MRPKLQQTTRQRPHERRPRRRRHRRESSPLAALGRLSPRDQDPMLARAREAGGPVDNASYSCACGYVFRASVSTTVSCPHCGAGQAW